MTKIFLHPSTGAPSVTPWTKEQAKRAGRPRYIDEGGCEWCVANRRISPEGHTTRFVSDDVCYGCHLVATHREIKTLPGPFSIAEAVARGASFYYGLPNGLPGCERGGHVAQTDLVTRECLVCRARSQEAKRVGLETARASRGGRYAPILDEAAALDAAGAVITRDQARALGMRVYRLGTACSRGHATCRYTSTGNCIECHNRRAG